MNILSIHTKKWANVDVNLTSNILRNFSEKQKELQQFAKRVY